MRHLFRVHLVASVLYLGLVAWESAQGHGWVPMGLRGAGNGRSRRLHDIHLALLPDAQIVIRRDPAASLRSNFTRHPCGFVVMLYFRIDVFMLDALIGREVVGQYALAFRFSEAFLLAGTAISASTFPRFVLLQDFADRGSATAFRALWEPSLWGRLSATVFPGPPIIRAVSSLPPGRIAARLPYLVGVLRICQPADG